MCAIHPAVGADGLSRFRISPSTSEGKGSTLLTIVAMVAALTFVLGLPVRLLLMRAQRLDMPNGRSSHTQATPRGGGLAILLAAFTALLLASLWGDVWDFEVWVAIAGAAALAGVGLLDDFSDLDPRLRLLSQVGIGAGIGVLLGSWPGAILGGLIIATAVNMVNFMDGINGLCAGHAAVWGVAALAAGALGGSDALGVLGAVSVGGALGFLPWNVPQARLFLGDVGSYLVGGVAGVGVTIAALGAFEGGATSLKVLAVVCAPYLLFAVDTATTLIRRARRGENLLEAHRDHVYQQLVHHRGWPHWGVSLAMSAVAALVASAFHLGWTFGAAAAVVVSLAYLSSPQMNVGRATV